MGYVADVGRNGLLLFASVGTLSINAIESRESANPSLKMMNSIEILFKMRPPSFWVRIPVTLAVLSDLQVSAPINDLASLIVPLVASATTKVVLNGVSFISRLKTDTVSLVLNLKMTPFLTAISLKIHCLKRSK